VPTTIRRLGQLDDLDRFGAIVVAAYHALPGHPPDPGYDAELVDVRHRVGTDVVLGAFDAATPLGCVTYVNDASSPHAERLRDGEASFRMLAVDVAAQRRGVGEALIDACLQHARAAGQAAVFIHSGEWMTAAHGLYARLGFVADAKRTWVVPGIGITLLGFRIEL
jgi:ribosomal protein S18 acetylase RimI-like enzyme